MSRFFATFFSFVFMLVSTSNSWAVIDNGDSQIIDFQTGIVENQSEETTTTTAIEYGPAAKKTDAGVALGGGANVSDAYVVGPPLMVGLKWYGFTNYQLDASMEGENLDAPGLVIFGRYSANGKKWTEWAPFSLEAVQTNNGPINKMICHFAVPSSQRALFHDKYYAEWAYPPGEIGTYDGRNEYQYWKYLEDHHPDVFEKEIPFIRFVQVRVEYQDRVIPPPVIRKLTSGSSYLMSAIRR